MAKKHAKKGSMPMHTFTILKQHTFDKVYYPGDKINLDNEKIATILLNKKIIK